MRHFATVITASHIGYARVLTASLREHSDDEVRLHVLVVDEQATGRGDGGDPPGLRRHGLRELHGLPYFEDIVDRYGSADDLDALRWSLKSVFLNHLLTRDSIAAVAYLDADQYFVGDPAVLFDFSPGTRLRLSPHWRPIDPEAGGVFHEQFRGGIFNGGVLVASEEARDVLSWWASVCAHRCETSPEGGLFADQKYLDVVPTYFDGIDVIRHKGVNVARWNRLYLDRRTDSEGRIRVEGDPLVCVHFSRSTIRLIEGGDDPVLEPVFRRYREALREEGVEPGVNAAESPRASGDGPRLVPEILVRGVRKGIRVLGAVRDAVREAW